MTTPNDESPQPGSADQATGGATPPLTPPPTAPAWAAPAAPAAPAPPPGSQAWPAPAQAWPASGPAWPPSGPPWGPGQPPPQQELKADGFAIASLILGIVGGVLFAVVFGILALRRIGRGERRGRGMAVAGLVLSLVWVVVFALLVVYGLTTSASRDDGGSVTKSGRIAVTDLQEGDCLEVPAQIGTVRNVQAHPCGEPHNGQVIANLTATDATFPGTASLESTGLDRCRDATRTFLGTSDTLLHVVVFVPTQQLWDKGDRTMACVLVDRQKEFTGDVRDDA